MLRAVIGGVCLLVCPGSLLADEVVVADTGALYSQPSETAAVRLVTNRPVPVRLVRRQGKWLQVETLTRTDPCPSHAGGAATRLRMFVRSRDLAKATRAPVTRRFSDGAEVKLRERFVLDEYTAPALIERVVANAPRALVVASTTRPYALLATAKIAKATQLRVGRSILSLSKGTQVRVVRRRGHRSLVRIVRPCMAITGWLASAALTKLGEQDWTVRATGSSYCGPKYHVKPGAPLFWPNGGRAGTTRTRHVMGCRGQPAKNGRVCTELRLVSWSGPVRVCFAKSYRTLAY